MVNILLIRASSDHWNFSIFSLRVCKFFCCKLMNNGSDSWGLHFHSWLHSLIIWMNTHSHFIVNLTINGPNQILIFLNQFLKLILPVHFFFFILVNENWSKNFVIQLWEIIFAVPSSSLFVLSHWYVPIIFIILSFEFTCHILFHIWMHKFFVMWVSIHSILLWGINIQWIVLYIAAFILFKVIIWGRISFFFFLDWFICSRVFWSKLSCISCIFFYLCFNLKGFFLGKHDFLSKLHESSKKYGSQNDQNKGCSNNYTSLRENFLVIGNFEYKSKCNSTSYHSSIWNKA